MFDWFFIVKHSIQDGAENNRESSRPSKSELVFSCLDDKLGAEELVRVKALAVEMTKPFLQLKNMHARQLEFFYFENGDVDDSLHVTCLLQSQTCVVYGFMGRAAIYGEMREILIALWRLQLEDYSPIALLLQEILSYCGHNPIAIYSFESSLYPDFKVEAKKNRLEDTALMELFSRLEVENILELCCALLLESTIIVSSARLDWISSCVLLLAKLFRPFKWQRIKVPLLNPSMVHVCSAPIPAIIGVHSSLLKEAMHQVVVENLGNAPNKLDTGFYLLIDADAQQKNCRLRRLDQMPQTQVSSSFPSTYVSALRNNWKAFLKKLSNGDLSIEEFVRLVYSSCHTFIAHLLLGYHSCYNSTSLEQTTPEQKHRSEPGFDTDKFLSLGTTQSSLQHTRQLLSNCQYFEQFVSSRNFGASTSSEGSKHNGKGDSTEYRQFDLVYNHVMKTERDRSERPSSNVSKLGQQFHSKVDTAYSRLSGQTSKLQSEMRSRTTKMKDLVRNKVPEASSMHKSSVFYLNAPDIISRTSRSVSVMDRSRRTNVETNEASLEDKATRRKTDNSADSRNVHKRRPKTARDVDLLNLNNQPIEAEHAADVLKPKPKNRDHSQHDSVNPLATDRVTSINLIDFDTVATVPQPKNPPSSSTVKFLFEEFDNLFAMEPNQDSGKSMDPIDSRGDNASFGDFNMDEELCSLFSNWVPSQSDISSKTNGVSHSDTTVHSNSDFCDSSNLIEFSANNPFNF